MPTDTTNVPPAIQNVYRELAGTFLVEAFRKASEVKIPPEVTSGMAIRCAAEVSLMLGATEEEFVEVCRQAAGMAAKEQREKKAKPASGGDRR